MSTPTTVSFIRRRLCGLQLSAGVWVWGVLQMELPDENPESLPTLLSTLGRRTSLAG
jgi:hypothetical protein